jgi:threonine/homoserine/homoserine lactone efflux protein
VNQSTIARWRRCLGVARSPRRVRRSGQALRWINRALGGLFVHLGARVAMLQVR